METVDEFYCEDCKKRQPHIFIESDDEDIWQYDCKECHETKILTASSPLTDFL